MGVAQMSDIFPCPVHFEVWCEGGDEGDEGVHLETLMGYSQATKKNKKQNSATWTEMG